LGPCFREVKLLEIRGVAKIMFMSKSSRFLLTWSLGHKDCVGPQSCSKKKTKKKACHIIQDNQATNITLRR
jgi:hypothetical protein